MNAIIEKYAAHLTRQAIPHDYAHRCTQTASMLLAKFPLDQVLRQKTALIYNDLYGLHQSKDGAKMIQSFRTYLKTEMISMDDAELISNYSYYLFKRGHAITYIDSMCRVAETLLKTMTPGHIANSTAEQLYEERYGDTGAQTTRYTRMTLIRTFQNFLKGGAEK